MLGVSESQFGKWVRRGWILPVKYPGIRATGFVASEVEALGARIIREGRRRASE